MQLMKIEGGLQTQGNFLKRGIPGFPLVSVVTVVYNGEQHLEETILSVVNQTYDNIEYIIIDGGSTDGTLDIIRRYEGRIDYWMSEKDGGIYDAMNKGVEVATGDWVICMNSGDAFYNNTVLQSVMHRISDADDVVYGQYVVNYGNDATRKARPRKIEDLWKGCLTSHQAVFIRTCLMKQHRFDCDFRLAADHEMIAKLFHYGCHLHYVPEIIAAVSAVGVSDAKRKDVYREYAKIAERYFPLQPFRVYFLFKYLDGICRSLLKRVIPAHIIRRLQIRNWNKF